MKIDVKGTVHKAWTEQTKNDKTIGHLVLFMGEGKFGDEYLALKVLGKTVSYLEGVQEGDVVTCAVDLKSSEAKNGTGKWYTDAVAFVIKPQQNDAPRPPARGQRDVQTRPSSPPADDDVDFP